MVNLTLTTGDAYDGLLPIFRDAAYPQVIYDVSTRARSLGLNQTPASIELNETSSKFVNGRIKRVDRLDQTPWTWEIILRFNVEVDFSTIRDILQNVPQIKSTRVLVQSGNYIHPPRNQPNTGSRAEFMLNLLQHPQ